MKVAAIDCGTNTLRLLVASLNPDGTLHEHARELSFVGLGEGVDATGEFRPDALQRAFLACDRYATIIDEQGCDKVRFVGTSAARDARNREELFEGVRQRLHVEPDLLSGDEEAALSFAGALSGVVVKAEPVLVMDAGGGSTELVRGDLDGTIRESRSMDIGSRRIRERFLLSDPPTDTQISRARAHIRRQLATSGVDLEAVRTFIGVAGTVTSLSAIVHKLPQYDRGKVHGSILDREQIEQVTDQLLSMSVAQVEQLGSAQPERAKVLCAGALIVDEVSQRVGCTNLIVSESDILDGIALRLLHP